MWSPLSECHRNGGDEDLKGNQRGLPDMRTAGGTLCVWQLTDCLNDGCLLFGRRRVGSLQVKVIKKKKNTDGLSFVGT